MHVPTVSNLRVRCAASVYAVQPPCKFPPCNFPPCNLPPCNFPPCNLPPCTLCSLRVRCAASVQFASVQLPPCTLCNLRVHFVAAWCGTEISFYTVICYAFHLPRLARSSSSCAFTSTESHGVPQTCTESQGVPVTLFNCPCHAA